MLRFQLNIFLISIVFSQSVKIAKSNAFAVSSPYIRFEVNNHIYQRAIHGKQLFELKNGKYVSEVVKTYSIKSGTVSFELYKNSGISSGDLFHTFKHYKNYFKRYKNHNYYFFSKISSIKTGGNKISFKLEKEGFFSLKYLCVYILNFPNANSFIKKDKFTIDEKYRGFGAYRILLKKSNSEIYYSDKSKKYSQISIEEFDNESSLINSFFQKRVDLYRFDYVQSLIAHEKSLLKTYIRRSYKKDYQNVISLAINPKRFKIGKRNEIKKLINLAKIQQQYLKYTGAVTNSLLHKETPYYFPIIKHRYDPRSAMIAIAKHNYKNKVKDVSRDKPFRLIYPSDDPLLEQIANSIVLDFSDANLFVLPIPLKREVYQIAITKQNYDFSIHNWSFSSDTDINLFRKLKYLNMLDGKRIIDHLDRLEIVNKKDSHIAIARQVQKIIYEQAIFQPMFILENDQYLINRSLKSFSKRVRDGNFFYYQILDFDQWE